MELSLSLLRIVRRLREARERRLLLRLQRDGWIDEARNAPTVVEMWLERVSDFDRPGSRPSLPGTAEVPDARPAQRWADDPPADVTAGMDGASSSFDAALNLLGPPPEPLRRPGATGRRGPTGTGTS